MDKAEGCSVWVGRVCAQVKVVWRLFAWSAALWEKLMTDLHAYGRLCSRSTRKRGVIGDEDSPKTLTIDGRNERGPLGREVVEGVEA